MRGCGVGPRESAARRQAPPDLDPHLEAASLLALSAGVGTSVLAGQAAVSEALRVIGYHLGRLFLSLLQG